MDINKILEVLIALGLIYFLFSTLVSTVYEWYSHKTQKRGRFLHEVINRLLNDDINQSFGATLYAHYNIARLKKNKDSYPQYISSESFADTLIDIIGALSEKSSFSNRFDAEGNILAVDMQENRLTDPYGRFVNGVETMKYSALKSVLRGLHEKNKTYETLKEAIIKWFDDYMARTSGWYKSKTKRALFYISLAVSLVFNLDSLHIIKELGDNDELRTSLVIKAEQAVHEKTIQEASPDSAMAKGDYGKWLEMVKQSKLIKDSLDNAYYLRVDSLVGEIENTGIPLGYHGLKDMKDAHGSYYLLWWMVGILVSATALSFGAPFWFDVISRAVNIRRAGLKPNKK